MPWMARVLTPIALGAAVFVMLTAAVASAQAPLTGAVRDETGAALPGVLVELRSGTAGVGQTNTNERGEYRLDGISPGRFELSFTLVNFATVRRSVTIGAEAQPVDVVLHLVLSANVTVSGKSTFTNLADAPDPSQDLVGVAQSASQGAVTARQLDTRPIMRPGEVLETVPGVVISQHSGEGKANQYYLRGFNLDHGTDFATTVAGMPVNMPTHGHGHGYSDLNFLIPELASGVQFSKGPYFAEHGDFATAGTANINYTNTLVRPIARVGGGNDAFGRVLVAAAPTVGRGTLLAALELEHSDGPWEQPDDLRKFNGLIRYTRGDGRNGLSATLMGYRGTWNSTDQIPARAVDDGRIGRFGLVDSTDGGASSRYSASLEWQRSNGNASTTLSAYGLKYDLDLFSNFTYFLDDPENGDQFQQTDHRFVSGARLTHRRIGRWLDRPTREYGRRPIQERQHRRHRPLSHARARAARHDPSGLGAPDEHGRFRAERDRVDAVAADARRRCASTVIASTSTPGSPRTAVPTTPDSSARKAARSSDRSQRPRSTSTPASASTATTRAARRSPSIRSPANRPVASRRSRARPAPRSASEPSASPGCR